MTTRLSLLAKICSSDWLSLGHYFYINLKMFYIYHCAPGGCILLWNSEFFIQKFYRINNAILLSVKCWYFSNLKVCVQPKTVYTHHLIFPVPVSAGKRVSFVTEKFFLTKYRLVITTTDFWSVCCSRYLFYECLALGQKFVKNYSISVVTAR